MGSSRRAEPRVAASAITAREVPPGPTAIADVPAWVTQAPIAAGAALLDRVAAADGGDEPFGGSKIGTIPGKSEWG